MANRSDVVTSKGPEKDKGPAGALDPKDLVTDPALDQDLFSTPGKPLDDPAAEEDASEEEEGEAEDPEAWREEEPVEGVYAGNQAWSCPKPDCEFNSESKQTVEEHMVWAHGTLPPEADSEEEVEDATSDTDEDNGSG